MAPLFLKSTFLGLCFVLLTFNVWADVDPSEPTPSEHYTGITMKDRLRFVAHIEQRLREHFDFFLNGSGFDTLENQDYMARVIKSILLTGTVDRGSLYALCNNLESYTNFMCEPFPQFSKPGSKDVGISFPNLDDPSGWRTFFENTADELAGALHRRSENPGGISSKQIEDIFLRYLAGQVLLNIPEVRGRPFKEYLAEMIMFPFFGALSGVFIGGLSDHPLAGTMISSGLGGLFAGYRTGSSLIKRWLHSKRRAESALATEAFWKRLEGWGISPPRGRSLDVQQDWAMSMINQQAEGSLLQELKDAADDREIERLRGELAKLKSELAKEARPVGEISLLNPIEASLALERETLRGQIESIKASLREALSQLKIDPERISEIVTPSSATPFSPKLLFQSELLIADGANGVTKLRAETMAARRVLEMLPLAKLRDYDPQLSELIDRARAANAEINFNVVQSFVTTPSPSNPGVLRFDLVFTSQGQSSTIHLSVPAIQQEDLARTVARGEWIKSLEGVLAKSNIATTGPHSATPELSGLSAAALEREFEELGAQIAGWLEDVKEDRIAAKQLEELLEALVRTKRESRLQTKAGRSALEALISQTKTTLAENQAYFEGIARKFKEQMDDSLFPTGRDELNQRLLNKMKEANLLPGDFYAITSRIAGESQNGEKARFELIPGIQQDGARPEPKFQNSPTSQMPGRLTLIVRVYARSSDGVESHREDLDVNIDILTKAQTWENISRDTSWFDSFFRDYPGLLAARAESVRRQSVLRKAAEARAASLSDSASPNCAAVVRQVATASH